jgi:hypothetical protein
MTESITEPRPDVAAFVEQVRSHLGDLTLEERDELVDGLEADLAEQLDDGATGLLGDPTSYAAELRAAAGLPPAPRRGRPRLPRATLAGLDGTLDRVRARSDALVTARHETRAAWSVVSALAPVWWVLRAWLAVTLLDRLTGPWERITSLPTFGVPGLGLVLLGVAVVLSVLVGQGHLWPGRPGRWPTQARLVLLALNVFAVTLLPALVGGPLTTSRAVASYENDTYYMGYRDAQSQQSGVAVNGRQLRNIYPYDASGQPISGVQLFDGAGRPIALTAEQTVSGASEVRIVGCPWFNGTQRLFNVFPLPERTQPNRTCSNPARPSTAGPVVLPAPPLAQVPPVTSGVTDPLATPGTSG